MREYLPALGVTNPRECVDEPLTKALANDTILRRVRNRFEWQRAKERDD